MTKCAEKPEKFADHYTQATLFWNSQTPYEKAHIVRGIPLRVDESAGSRLSANAWFLCSQCRGRARAAGGRWARHPAAQADAASDRPPRPEVKRSPALSLTFRPGDGSIRGRKVAILIAPGVEGARWRRRKRR